MLKSLVWINIRQLFAGLNQTKANGKRRGKGMMIVFALLMVYVLVVFWGLFGSMFMELYEPFHLIGLDWFYFSLAGIMSFCLCFIFSIFAAKSQLFDAKDNELLLSMPIQPMTILLSRVLSLLALNYLYSGIVLLPAFVAYLINGSLPVMGIISFVLVFLTLPLLSLAFSCLFGWLLALVTSKMRRQNVMTLVLSFGFLAIYFYVYSHAYQYLNALIENGETIARAVQRTVFPAYHMGLAIADGNLLSLIIILLTAIVPFALVMYVLSRTFISIATANKAAVKAVYKEKKLKTSGAGMALFKKDLAGFFASPIYIMNTSMGTVFAVVLSGLALFNLGTIREIGDAAGEMGLSFPLLASAAICMCVCMNTVSAPSVSLEGKTLWICRTLPMPTKSVLLTKALLHFTITEPAVIIPAVVFTILLKPAPAELFLMLILPTALNAFCALMGVAVNIQFPRFDWINETQVIKQSMAVGVTMFASILAVFTPILLYIFLFSDRIGLTGYLSACAAIYIALAGLLYWYISGPGSRKLESM